MRKIEAYTDGSCKPNPGVGGWGWISYEESILPNIIGEFTTLVISDYGGLKQTTNQQMELMAMAELLESCPKGTHVDIYTDSDYTLGGIVGQQVRKLTLVDAPQQVTNGLSPWMRGWASVWSTLGVKYSDKYWKKEIKNPHEWYRIHQALMMHAKCGTTLYFCWVKGHSGVKGNEEADRLANLFSAH